MGKINIPDRIVNGFKLISDLKPDQVEAITSFFKSISIGSKLDDTASGLSEILDDPSAHTLIQTLISFTDLLEPNEGNKEILATHLSESYFDSHRSKDSPKARNKLKDNLISIIESTTTFRTNFKSRALKLENEHNFSRAKIITDIRIYFEEDRDDLVERPGFILHNLSIEYQKDLKLRELHLSMDIEDLKDLKIEIEKAIVKEELIRKNYSQNINYLD